MLLKNLYLTGNSRYKHYIEKDMRVNTMIPNLFLYERENDTYYDFPMPKKHFIEKRYPEKNMRTNTMLPYSSSYMNGSYYNFLRYGSAVVISDCKTLSTTKHINEVNI